MPNIPPWINAGRDWFRIVNEADTTTPVEVYIFDSIGFSWFGGVSAQSFAEAWSAIDDDRPVEVHINSPGGDVFDGHAIANLIRQHPAQTTSYIDGLAASAASYIAIAADEVVIAPGAEIMIHEASSGCLGIAEDMRRTADDLDRINLGIARSYVTKAGGELDDWLEAMASETWYSAEEAVAAGLADRLLEGAGETDVEEAKAAHLASPVFAHAGRAHAPAPRIPSHPRTPAASGGYRPTATTHRKERPVFTDAELTTMRQELGLPEDADSATILAALHEALNERADTPQNSTTIDGVVTIDEAILEQLRADAAAGREALAHQQQARREQLVEAAVADGRVRPADRDRWLTNLGLDPEGFEAVLGGLQPGLVPLAEIGTASNDSALVDDALYEALYGKDA